MVAHQLDHLSLVPRDSGCGVFMNKISTLFHLLLVDPDHEVQMQLALADDGSDLLLVHLAEVHLSVPGAERCARGRSYHKVRILLVNHLHGQLTIAPLREVPRCAIWLGSPEVASGQSPYIEVAP